MVLEFTAAVVASIRATVAAAAVVFDFGTGRSEQSDCDCRT